MVRIRLRGGWLLVLAAAGCATPAGSTQPGPDAEIPLFAADDPRVGTAGFVGETLRLHEEHDGMRHTLMAFAVGDTLTLGAMVRGTFAGEVRWQVGGRSLSFPFDSENVRREVAVRIDGDDTPLSGQGASFRGTTWVNVEVPLAAWGAEGTALQLAFVQHTGAAVVLPDGGYHYVVRHARR